MGGSQFRGLISYEHRFTFSAATANHFHAICPNLDSGVADSSCRRFRLVLDERVQNIRTAR